MEVEVIGVYDEPGADEPRPSTSRHGPMRATTRRIWGLAASALFAFLLSGCAGCEVRVEVNQPPEEQEVNGAGFETKIPGDWSVEPPDVVEPFEAKQNQARGLFRLEVDGIWRGIEADDAGAVIAGRDLRAVSGLHDYVRRLIGWQGRGIPRFELTVEPRATTLDGASALAYEYRGMPSGPVRVREMAVSHEGITYLISLTTSPQAFDSFRPRFDEILESWTWVD